MLYKENLISNQDLMSHLLDPFTFNDKPVIAGHAAHLSFNIVNSLFFTYIFILQDDIRA